MDSIQSQDDLAWEANLHGAETEMLDLRNEELLPEDRSDGVRVNFF